MKKRIFAGAVMFLAVLFVGAVPSAQAQFTLNFDENGNGSIDTGAGFVPLQGVLAPDTSQSQTNPPLALMYLLPTSVTPGDVRIFEQNDATTESDGLRFTDNCGGVVLASTSCMYYYSEAEASGIGDLADTGLPTLGGPAVFEDGPEGANGFTYTAAGPNIYNGISDTPEASSFLLLGTGLLSIAGYMRRKWLA